MKKTLCIILAVSIAVLFSSCARVPTRTEIENANYGYPPSEQYIEYAITRSLSASLIDPGSMQIQIDVPIKGWSHNKKGEEFLYGYWVFFALNSKNRYGGYVGTQIACAFFQGEYLHVLYHKTASCQYMAHISFMEDASQLRIIRARE